MLVRPYSETMLPTHRGDLRLAVYRDDEGREHAVAIVGRAAPGAAVEVHRACLMGDVFCSMWCHCRERVDAALDRFFASGAGVLVYLRGGTDQAAAAILEHLGLNPSPAAPA